VKEFHDPSSRPWEAVEGVDGLYERIIAGKQGSPDHSRMGGGVVLEGSLGDLRLDEEFSAGMYACRPPGMPHGPWRTERGCVTFEVRYSEPAGERHA